MQQQQSLQEQVQSLTKNHTSVTMTPVPPRTTRLRDRLTRLVLPNRMLPRKLRVSHTEQESHNITP